MGFYGNITNMARTSFTFDKTYPNRQAMDAGAGQDEVFVGRYVLVDYDNNDFNFIFSYKWIDEGTGETYFSQSFSSTSTAGAYRWKSLKANEIIVVPANKDGQNKDYNQADPNATVDEYWKCTGVDSEGYNIFEPVVATKDSYTANYNIDTAQYGNGRGYDSTAWQKTVVNGETKYVMVAELNSVVPSFGITADAPTMVSVQPHWSSDSTNVYYELHWPMPWNIRIKGAKRNTTLPQLDEWGVANNATGIVSSAEDKEYPNDSTTIWKKTTVNKDTENYEINYASWDKDANKLIWVNNKDNAVEQPAAIYFNKAGLNPDIIAYSSDKEYAGWGKDGESGHVTDEVTLEPTGRSGYGYNKHGSNSFEKDYNAADAMELSVMLPSLGDTVAKMWDLVYGDRKANANNKNEVEDVTYRNKDISWEDGRFHLQRSGLRLVPQLANAVDDMDDYQSRYRPDRVETIAGAINSVHDLMGMIIIPTRSEDMATSIDDFDENKIYYNKTDGEYYRKKTSYSFTPIQEYYFNQGHAEGESPYQFDDVTSKITSKNFDANLLYTKNGDTYEPVNSDPNAVYNSSTTYYARKFKEEMEPYKLASQLMNFEPDKVWFKDYVGSTASEDRLKHDFCQDEYYQYGKQYFTITNPQQITNLSERAYAPNIYWYREEDNVYSDFILETAEDPVPGRVYYEINWKEYYTEDGVRKVRYKDLDASGSPYKLSYYSNYDGIYVPGQYYYYSRTGMAYRLSNYEKLEDAVRDMYIDADSGGTHGRVFYKIKDSTVTIDGSNTIYTRSLLFVNTSHADNSANKVTADTYYPGSFYILDPNKTTITSVSAKDSAIESDFIVDNSETFDPDQVYWIKQESLTPTTDTSKIIDFSKEYRLVQFQDNSFYQKQINIHNGVTEVRYHALRRNEIRAGEKNYLVFWSSNNDPNFSGVTPKNTIFDWIANLVNNASHPEYHDPYIYDYFAVHRYKDFFQRNSYHKVVENPVTHGVDYVLATELIRDPNATYVFLGDDPQLTDPTATSNINDIVKAIPTNQNGEPLFYYPYKFYEKVGDTYHLVTTKDIPYKKTYSYNQSTGEYDIEEIVYDENNQPVLEDLYTKNSYYVWGDSAGIHQIGEEWNSNIPYIPSTINLAIRDEQNTMEALPGFARNITTIHGMLLKLWQLLELNDATTRDNRTAQGLMNSMNDVLKKIHELTPGQLAYVNDYGQISTTPVQTDDWIDYEINSRVKDPSISIKHHDIIPVEDTETEGNVNDNGDTIKLYTPLLDVKGHVVGKNTQTVTLPYSFKTVTPANSNATSNLDNNTTPIVADNTQSNITIQGANTWIHTNGTDGTTNTLKIGHLVQNITTTAENPTDLNDGTDTITVQDITQDEAGHIRSNKPHTYTLPYGYKTVKVTNDPNAVTDAVSTVVVNGQSADNTQDTLTFSASNKWLKLDNNTEDTIKVGHLVQAITTTAITGTDINGNGNTITLQDISYDEAGHITAKQPHEYTLPYGYKAVKVGSENIVADNTQDDIEVVAGDAWVELAGSANAHTITATHADAQTTAASVDVNGGNATLTPAFGGTFNIPTFGFDAKGHYKEYGSTTVTIPTNIGTLALEGYSSDTSVTSPIISASDTVNGAISKLEKSLKDEADERERAETTLSQAIATEATDRQNAISGLNMTAVTASTGEVISSISEANGVVSATVKTLTAEDIPNIEFSQVVDSENETDLPTKLATFLTADTNAGSYTETQISIDPITEEETSEEVEVQVSYGQSFNKLYGIIAQLSARIADLETRIEALENPSTEPEPEPESQTEP